MVEVARDPALADDLALRGGAALHHLHLDRPLRRCDDLSYGRTSSTGLGPILEGLRLVAGRLDMVIERPELRDDGLHARIDAPAEPGTLSVSVDAHAIEPCRPHVRRRLRVGFGPGATEADVLTFALDDILALTLRQLSQRRDPRDLFDLWAGLTIGDASAGDVASCFRHYVAPAQAPADELLDHLELTLADEAVRDGFVHLTVRAPVDSIDDADAVVRGVISAIP